MRIEKEIVSYLEYYGNTRENDLISYGTDTLDLQANDMRRTINRLAIKGKIHRVVHSKLAPPVVYISLDEQFPPEILKGLHANSSGALDQDVNRILEEASAVAGKIRDIEPEKY